MSNTADQTISGSAPGRGHYSDDMTHGATTVTGMVAGAGRVRGICHRDRRQRQP